MAQHRYNRKSTFWAWLIGLAILAVLVWGVWEIFDDDYEEVGVGEDEIGWVNDDFEGENVEVEPFEEEVEPRDEFGELRQREIVE